MLQPWETPLPLKVSKCMKGDVCPMCLCGVKREGHDDLTLVLWWMLIGSIVFQLTIVIWNHQWPPCLVSASGGPTRTPWVRVPYFSSSSSNETAGSAFHPIAFWATVPFSIQLCSFFLWSNQPNFISMYYLFKCLDIHFFKLASFLSVFSTCI